MKNLRLALRSLLHFRLYTIINMLGLALALACVIVIFRYVHGELTMNRFHDNLDRLYVGMAKHIPLNTIIEEKILVPEYTSRSEDELLNDPAIALSSRYYYDSNRTVTTDQRSMKANIISTDSNFLRLLRFPVLAGPEWITADQAYITPDFAKKLFGNADPIGQRIVWQSGYEAIVAGIVQDYPSRNGLPFNIILSSEERLRATTIKDGNTTVVTTPASAWIILLHPRQDYRQLVEKYDPLHHPGMNPQSKAELTPLKEAYFSPSTLYGFRKGNKGTILLLSAVGILILAIGILNFINIYTAVTLRRGREFGMKKVFGAPSGQVFIQLWMENGVMIGLALVLALALTELVNPLVKNILGFNQLPFVGFDLLLVLALLLVIPLMTTIFPFFRYNYSLPITSLRSVGKTGGKSRSRWVFTAFQYIITLVLIMVSTLFLKQLHSMLTTDPGYRTEDIIRANFMQPLGAPPLSYQENRQRMDLIKEKIASSPLFTHWAQGPNPSQTGKISQMRVPGGELKTVQYIATDTRWLELFEIPFFAKDDGFDMEAIDFIGSEVFILSESALKLFEISDFREAIIDPAQVLWRTYTYDADGDHMRTNGSAFRVVGVIPDLKVKHLKEENPPAVISLTTNLTGGNDILASIASGKKQEAIEFLRELHQETTGGEFTYMFIEDNVKDLYKEDKKITLIYSVFTVIAILISALGLFSISLFDVQQRFKEIAIRKVNGATTGIIIGLLLKRYMILLGISFLIAIPIAWFAIQRYLENFAYRTSISWWIFALALVITAGVSLLTLIHQTRKAAATNPADVIRSE